MRALVVLLLTCLALSASAQETAETAEARGARAFFEIGAQAYDRGDYDGALEAFKEAYARAARPGLLFSMAQAHRRAFFAGNDPQHHYDHFHFEARAAGDKVVSRPTRELPTEEDPADPAEGSTVDPAGAPDENLVAAPASP